MGWGTGNLVGGSGGLNFNIVSYATESELLADTPKENTIGVITSIPITGYHFGTEEPSPAAAGMVWITTGTSSQVEFNALKKNGIQVYPMSAKQMVSGALKKVTAKSYQGGKWVEWIPAGALYWEGYKAETVTGGWTHTNSTAAPTFGNNSISISLGGSSGYVHIHTVKKIDVTPYQKLHCAFSATNRTFWGDIGIGLIDTAGQDNYIAKKMDNSTNDLVDVTFTVDISSVNKACYVQFGGSGFNGEITKIWME